MPGCLQGGLLSLRGGKGPALDRRDLNWRGSPQVGVDSFKSGGLRAVICTMRRRLTFPAFYLDGIHGWTCFQDVVISFLVPPVPLCNELLLLHPSHEVWPLSLTRSSIGTLPAYPTSPFPAIVLGEFLEQDLLRLLTGSRCH